MTASMKRITHRLRAAWGALLGRGADAPAGAADLAGEAGGEDVSSLRARLAGLRMDVEDRDREMARLKQEYAQLRERAKAEATDAGAGEILKLLRKAAPLLSQIPTMQAMSVRGVEVKAGDLLKLTVKLEKIFHDAGLEALGRVGETMPFDGRVHQRLSGGDVREGDPVKVRFVGYRFGDQVVTKAMVSREQGDSAGLGQAGADGEPGSANPGRGED